MIGVFAKRLESVSGSSIMIIYPLLFASNILVDSATRNGFKLSSISIQLVLEQRR